MVLSVAVGHSSHEGRSWCFSDRTFGFSNAVFWLCQRPEPGRSLQMQISKA